MNLLIDPSEYKDFAYNTTILNERAIETVLAERFIQKYGNGILEVGAVSPYYFNVSHEIADPYDDHPKATNKQKAEEIDYRGRDVLSISTVEHIGQIPPSLPTEAYPVVEKIFKESRNCLISFPMGFNLDLENRVKENRDWLKPMFYVRTEQRKWEFGPEGFGLPYPSPQFGWASAIVVISKFQNE